MSELLKISGLYVSAEEKELLHGVSLSIESGSTHVLMGPNGAGKSTLGLTIMGSPEYTVSGGNIVFEGEDITDAGLITAIITEDGINYPPYDFN